MEGKRKIMKNFLVINEANVVINNIVADSQEIAVSVTNLTCIENVDEIGKIGQIYSDGIFSDPV